MIKEIKPGILIFQGREEKREIGVHILEFGSIWILNEDFEVKGRNDKSCCNCQQG